MNNGLETLNLLKDFVLKDNKNGLDRRFIIGSCDILEQELKDYEVLKKDFESMREFKYKQLDALEIIIKYIGASPILFFMRQANASKKEIELVEEVLHEKEYL